MERSRIRMGACIFLALCSLARVLHASASTGHPLEQLRDIAELTNEDAGRSLPVRFKAQVLLASRAPDWLFVQTDQQGLFVAPPQSGFLPLAGDWVTISGHTAKGGLDPIVKAEQIVVIGHGPLPSPLELTGAPPSPAVVINVAAKIKAFILRIAPTGFPHTTRLLLRGPAGNSMLALVAHAESCDPDRLVHATAELTGVYGVVATRGALYMDSCASARIIKLPEISWDLPPVPIDQLLTVRSATKIGDIVHLRGQVTMVDPSMQRLYIQQKQRGLPIYLAPSSGSFSLGESVDVVGVLDEDSRLLLCLTGARIKRAVSIEDITPLPAAAGTMLTASLNGTLLQVTGLVTSSRVNAGALELVLGSGHYRVAASIPMTAFPQRYLPQTGDSVVATGILDILSDPELLSYNLSLLARSFDDLHIASRGPWYQRTNWGRVASALGALAVAFVAMAVFWWRRAVKRSREAAELGRVNEVLAHCLSRVGAENDADEAVRISLREILAYSSARSLRWFEYDEAAEALKTAIVIPDADPLALSGQRNADSAEATQLVERLLHSQGFAVHQSRNALGVWLPVHLGSQFIGLVQLLGRHRSSFLLSEVNLLGTLTTYLAFAVHLARLVQRANLTATLEERNRIAREIHDSLTQCFTGILMQLQAAAKYAVRDDTTALACIQRAQTLARDGLREARHSVVNLIDASVEHYDLEGKIRTLLEAATGDTDLKFDLRVRGESRPLDQTILQNLIRICQEGLSNTQRYASARCIFVDLDFGPDRLTLALRDDGVGFSPDEALERGFGITGMRARAARLNADFSLKSDHGRGTMISVAVPYHLVPTASTLKGYEGTRQGERANG